MQFFEQAGLDYTGIIIENLTGATLEEYFQENILKPAGVENLGFWMTEAMHAELSNMHLRKQPDGTIIQIPHIEPAARQPPGAKVKCRSGGGCFGPVQEYASKNSHLRLTQPHNSLTGHFKQ